MQGIFVGIYFVNIAKKIVRYFILFFSCSFYGQVLHHQMLSAQGASTTTTSGLVVNQTIGQQSAIGNSNDKFIIIQGFQQSLWSKYIASNKIDAIEDIKTITYPNPFTETINFQISKPILSPIKVCIFDIRGRIIYDQNGMFVNSILSIDLASLPTSQYLVRLTSTNFSYYTKIIKQ